MASTSITLTSSSPESTRDLGRTTAAICMPGDVIALVGDVGAGKTTYVQGIGQGLGAESEVTSSTFVLMKQYTGYELDLYHVDLYRLETLEEARSLDLDEFLFGDGVTAIEWADRFKALLPDQYLLVNISYEGNACRNITVRGIGARGCAMEEELRNALSRSKRP